MGGGLMQLVAYGAQDIYLTGNPQITFFKVVYRRHTNFSMETIQQTLSGSSSTPVGGSASSTCVISRNGDLVYRVYARVKSTNNITIRFHDSSIGILNLFDSVELEIGGQLIDRHTAQWMSVWENISQTNDNHEVIWGEKIEYNRFGDGGDILSSQLDNYRTTPYRYINVPFNFWFCRNPGLALPLIALQYHEVKIKISTEASTNFFKSSYVLNGGAKGSIDYDIFCDYIYLDTDERRRFAQVSHEYLIEQVQIQGGGSGSSQKLNFNHPVKFISWTSQTNIQSINSDATIQLNGHDRFSKQSPEYFYKKQFIDYFNPIKQNMGTELLVDYDENADSRHPSQSPLDSTVIDNHIAGNGNSNDSIKYTTYRIYSSTHSNKLARIEFSPNWLSPSEESKITTGGQSQKFGIRLWTSTDGSISNSYKSGHTDGNSTSYGYRTSGTASTYTFEEDVAKPNNAAALIAPDMTKTNNSVIEAASSGTPFTNFDFEESLSGVAATFSIQPQTNRTSLSAENPVISFTFTPPSTPDIILKDKFLFITFYTMNINLHGGAIINRNKISIYTEHTIPPALDEIKLNVNNSKIVGSVDAHFLNAYSFALKPLEHQPSGTCNFSRIDNAKLIFEGGTPPTIDNIYAVNYNVLRIMSGMGGLAYSN